MSSKTKTTATKGEAKPALVPKLRFPEFRGKEGWEPATLGEKSSILKGKGISKADLDPNGSQTCIRYGELYTRYGETIREAVSRTKVPASELFLSKPDDVIIPSSGETKIDIAKASCVLAGGIALGGDLNIIRSKLNGTFLSYYLNGPKRLDIAKVAQGDTVVHLYPHQLEALHIAVPTPAEQQKIAECLSSVDELMAAQARKVDALKTHKKGLMQQLFPREGETQPHLRFPEFQTAGEWVTQPFAELYDFKPTNTFSRDQLNYESGPAKNIHYGDIHTKFSTSFRIEAETVPFVNSSASLSKLKSDAYCQEGDMVFADASENLADVGKSIELVELNGEKVLSGSHTILARQNENVFSVGFAGHLFKGRGVRARIEKEAQGTKVLQISPGRLAGIQVVFPRSKAEQQRIAVCLSSLDALITAETQKHEALKTHKKGLMQQLFPSENSELRGENGDVGNEK